MSPETTLGYALLFVSGRLAAGRMKDLKPNLFGGEIWFRVVAAPAPERVII